MNLSEIFRGRLTTEKWRALGEYLSGSSIRGGPGVRVRTVGNRIVVSAKRRAGGGVSGESVYPFKISDASTEADGCRVTVAPGMVESSYGTGPFPSNLWPDPADPLYLSVTADVMWVRLVSVITTGDTPAIDSMEIDITDTLAEDTADTAYLIIGEVTSEVVSGTRQITSIFNNVRSNLLHSLAFEGYSYPDYWRQIIGPVASPSA